MLNFPYEKAGFTYDQWFHIPSAEKRNIKDWYIAGRNREQGQKFCFFETDWSMRHIENAYRMRTRPIVYFNSETLEFI